MVMASSNKKPYLATEEPAMQNSYLGMVQVSIEN